MRARSRWMHLAVALVVSAVATGSGCGSCDVSCAPHDEAAADGRTVVGNVESIDGQVVRVEVEDGTELDVRTFGRVEVLEVGRSYVLPLGEDAEGTPTAALPDPCDCGGPYITELDGTVVDTAYFPRLRSIDVTTAAAAVVGIGVVVIVGWGAWRRRRGLPL